MRVFDWLLEHGEKAYSGQQWADLLGIEIIDPDGWRDTDTPWHTPLLLYEFLDRVKGSTIG